MVRLLTIIKIVMRMIKINRNLCGFYFTKNTEVVIWLEREIRVSIPGLFEWDEIQRYSC